MKQHDDFTVAQVGEDGTNYRTDLDIGCCGGLIIEDERWCCSLR